jgi:hypothetical protein
MAASANPPETAIFPWFFIPRKYGSFRRMVVLREGEDGGQRKRVFLRTGRV